MSATTPLADTRLKAVVAREQRMPQVLLEARRNLKNPPRIFTEIALEQIDGIVGFFQSDVPSAFPDGPGDAHIDPATRAAFLKSNAAVIQALKDYGVWMKSDLLPRSTGDYKLGADTFSKNSSTTKWLTLPSTVCSKSPTPTCTRTRPSSPASPNRSIRQKTPQEVLAQLAAIHPEPAKLLDAFHGQFNDLIAYIRTHHIVTIPSDVQPTLEETPPFERATTQASMDSPGPFETHSKKAYFNVTLPEANWTPQHVAEHMAAFNEGTIVSTSVHEAYPGHYVQFLYVPQIQSKVRKLTGASSNIEGWAHYCEQMMLDEGYAAPGPNATPDEIRTSRLIRLGQLQDALLRDARFVNSIKLHTGQGNLPAGRRPLRQGRLPVAIESA